MKMQHTDPAGTSIRFVTVLSLLFVFLFAPLLAAQEHEHVESEHFDVYAKKKETAKKQVKPLEEMAKRFEDLFEKDVPRGAVVMFTDFSAIQDMRSVNRKKYMKNGAEWFFPWVKNIMSGKMKKKMDKLPDRIKSKMKPLTHEAAHVLAQHVFTDFSEQAKKKGKTSYGTPFPDWFDEGIAVYHETDFFRKQRKKNLRENLDSMIPLKELFQMEHPIHKQMKGKDHGSGPIRGSKLEDPQKAMKFYAQSYGLFVFFREMEGKKFIRTLAEEFQKGKDIETILEKHADNLPSDLEKLNKRWTDWCTSWVRPKAEDDAGSNEEKAEEHDTENEKSDGPKTESSDDDADEKEENDGDNEDGRRDVW